MICQYRPGSVQQIRIEHSHSKPCSIRDIHKNKRYGNLVKSPQQPEEKAMNDFLKNLRSSHKKEMPPPRKNMDSHYYAQTDRRVVRDRRTVTNQPSQHTAKPLDDRFQKMGEILPMVLDNTTALMEQVEKIATINEMMMESKIRKNNAVADFFEGLTALIHNTDTVGMLTPKKATASYASGTHYTKDDILSIIQNMRDQGTTFSIIADYLKEKGIPTFSGRGEWHAQTIHRLCK